MLRLVPVRYSWEFTKFSEDGKPLEEVLRIQYEEIECTDHEYETALKMMEPFLLPGPWRAKARAT